MKIWPATSSGRHSLKSVCNTWIRRERSSIKPRTANPARAFPQSKIEISIVVISEIYFQKVLRMDSEIKIEDYKCKLLAQNNSRAADGYPLFINVPSKIFTPSSITFGNNADLDITFIHWADFLNNITLPPLI
jgi:hypothetical protein